MTRLFDEPVVPKHLADHPKGETRNWYYSGYFNKARYRESMIVRSEASTLQPGESKMVIWKITQRYYKTDDGDKKITNFQGIEVLDMKFPGLTGKRTNFVAP